VVIANRADLPALLQRLRPLGYQHEADSDLADAYGDLKRTLATRLGHDRLAYTGAKSAFVERVLTEASPPLAGPRRGRNRVVNDRNAAHNHG
jgi:hypothetical protein